MSYYFFKKQQLKTNSLLFIEQDILFCTRSMLSDSQQLFLCYKLFLPSGKHIISYIFISVLHVAGKGGAFQSGVGGPAYTGALSL